MNYDKNITRKSIGYFILTLLLFSYSCAPEATTEEAAEPQNETRRQKVSTLDVKNEIFEHYFTVQGAVKANKNVIVTPEVGGLIKSLRVKEGQYIKRGQTIASFNSDVVNSNLDELEEQIEIAKYMYEKQQSLMAKGVGTEIALKQSEAQYKALLKARSSINTQKDKFVLVSPFSGYVETVFPVVGQLVGPTSPIIRLINLNDLMVVANVSESYLKDLELSNKVSLHFPALETTIENLSIHRIGKMVNPVDRTLPIEIKIPNPTNKMVPNLMTVIKIRDYVQEDAIVIPSRTILKNAKQEDFVLLLSSENIVKAQIIKTGNIYNNKTEIISGLKEGDIIIDRGARKVVEGDQVEVQN